MNLPVGMGARLRAIRILHLVALTAGVAAAATFSETGNLSSPEDVATFSVNLTNVGNI